MKLNLLAAGLLAISAYSAVPSGPVNIISKYSGKCLDIEGGPRATAPGVPAQQWACIGNSQTNQIFSLHQLAGAAYEIIPLNSGLAVQVSGASPPEGSQLEQAGFGSESFQEWRLTASGSQYTIHPASDPAMCVDVRGKSASNGAAIQIWPCNGGSSQAWNLSPITLSARAQDIATAQFDSARTASNGSEIYLTTADVNGTHFGKLFARTVDGAIFAQPLFLQGLVLSSQKKTNLVYVATSHNNVYAFDADQANASNPVWSVNLGPYVTTSGWNTGLGVLSTPLIVRNSGAIYVTAVTNENGTRVYRLHALDLRTGAEKFGGPVVIAGSVTGSSGDAVKGVVSFNANYHIQRTGLALSGNNVVFAFSADRDHPYYHGWIFSYDIDTLQQTGIFNDTRGGAAYYGTGAGIWQSGRAPAVDGNGSVYFETGNGNFDGTIDFGETFLKLAPNSGLSLSDWFTPGNWQTLNRYDYDLSSIGPVLVTGQGLLFGGGKAGTIYLLSTSNLGHLSANAAGVIQEFQATAGCATPFVDQGCAQIMSYAFWPTAPVQTLYIWGVHDVLRAYQFTGGRFDTTPAGTGAAQAYYPGGLLSLSSYRGTAGTGMLWATVCDTPDNGFFFGPGFTGSGSLHAFDATTLTEVWNSNDNSARDGLGNFASFAAPVAVNGKVYVPTFSNQLVVYGLLNGPVFGDLNGDSVVNCTDVSIVKAASGKSKGQPGFDLRADVNSDGLVNNVDLSIVEQLGASQQVCNNSL